MAVPDFSWVELYMFGLPCSFVLCGDDAVISGFDEGSGKRLTIQLLNVYHLFQRNLFTLFCSQFFDKHLLGNKKETGKEITTLLYAIL